MRFGPVPLAEAGGAILAHSADLPGGRLRKGKVLERADLERMAAAGRDAVIVARLDPGDLAEDAAAEAIARALVPDPAAAGLRIGAATTGRVNLHATGPGVLRVAAERVAALNAVNPLITLATLPPFARLAEGTMVATVKIIAYGVPAADVTAAAAAGLGALSRAAPVVAAAALVETQLTGIDPGDKGLRALRTRLGRLGIALTGRTLVPHRTDPLARALRAARGEAIFVLTASATSDPEDVGPAALRAAGGRVERFGMPVDPGNLLFLGDLDGRPVIGLPGCARSPALNGADWVLERVLCGLPVSAADIAAMGVGGLLKETPARGRLREG